MRGGHSQASGGGNGRRDLAVLDVFSALALADRNRVFKTNF